MDKKKKLPGLRKIVQAGWGILTNAYAKGFATGTIYRGPLKRFCVPGMNCYSCPGALGACPIGAMQAVFTGRRRKISLYVAGFLATVGLLVGRLICGWLCLFGLLQEWLYLVPVPKVKVPEKADRALRYLKYVMLALLVILLPLLWRGETGLGEPFFCKYVCPVGTLEGGVFLVLLNRSMRAAAGFLFHWKMLLLVLTLLACMFIYRPFCKYICPLGAFYALFQKVSLLRMNVDKESCVHCGACISVCHMQVDPVKQPNSGECIRCGECMRACPKKAISFSVTEKRSTAGEKIY